MGFLQNCEFCFNQERLSITYHSFCHKSLVRPKSKSSNWQRSQPISYETKLSQRDNIYLGSDRLLYPKMLKLAKELPNNIHRWVFYKISKFESLPKADHKFLHQSLVRPKNKSSNCKRSETISYKANFSQKKTMHLIDVKFNITYQNNQRIIKVRPFLRN